uniref:Uncharacterized protein n=1 Tax=Hyaloperonospora arabidopsidis (strain Emoy2) TaxID=559515 RepID=M4C0H6_HYAAE
MRSFLRFDVEPQESCISLLCQLSQITARMNIGQSFCGSAGLLIKLSLLFKFGERQVSQIAKHRLPKSASTRAVRPRL